MPLLVTSSSAALRIEFARRKLEEWTGEAEVHIVAATRAAADDLVRTLELTEGRAGLHRSTPLQLALEVASVALANQGLAPVSGIALHALTVGSIHRALRQQGLRYFERVYDTVGFTNALRRTLTELRMETLRPDALDTRTRSGADIRLLLECFEQELDDGKLADPASVYRNASVCLDSGSDREPKGRILLLDVLPDSRAESHFVSALARTRAEVIAVALPASGRGMSFLEEALGVQARPLDEGPSTRTLDQIRSFVFAPESPDPRPGDDTLNFFSATDEGRECVEIARYIAAAGKHTRFDDVAILLRDPDTYQPLVEEALSRAGIPAFFTRASRRPNAAGRAFLSLLACRSENLSASRFAEYLSLGQVPIPNAAGAPPAPAPHWVPTEGELFGENPVPEGESVADDIAVEDPDNSAVVAGSLSAPDKWEQLLVDASVIAGKERWQSRLEGLGHELHDQIQEIEHDDESRRQHLERQVQRLERLSAFALPAISALSELPDEAPWGEWLERLEKLAASTLRHAEPVLTVLGELRPLDLIGPVTLEDVERVLSERLSFLRNEPPERRYGRVFVSSIPEVAGRSFSVVFIPGLSEGLFPRKSAEDPLLWDVHRRALNTTLRVSTDRSRQERYLLRLALGSARDRLCVSYPRMDLGQGRARVPSFYALDILRAGEGAIPDLGELERRAIESSRSRLGWPSPVEPSDAIDDAEYDLATIGGLMHRPPSTVRGHASYLIESHPILARSLRSRARRWRNFWSSADGLVDPSKATLGILRAYSMKARAYSPTALEQFAICPYRFFLRAVHRLYPRTDVVRFEQLDPLTRGLLFHAVQFRLLTELKDRALPITAVNVDRISLTADRILDDTADEYKTRLAPAITRIWEQELEDLRSDLRGWLLREAQNNSEDPGWVPQHFELAFGPGSRTLDRERDPASSEAGAQLPGGYQLRGAIDLIEEHRDTRLLRIVDHKTGRVPSDIPKATGSGETLQPLLYAMAVENLTGQTVSLSKLSYCTNRGDFRSVEIPVDDETKRAAEATLDDINTMISTGFFPAAPRPGACGNCDYRIVCGPYEELRTSRKRQERLENLQRIRQIP